MPREVSLPYDQMFLTLFPSVPSEDIGFTLETAETERCYQLGRARHLVAVLDLPPYTEIYREKVLNTLAISQLRGTTKCYTLSET